jgi:hypothetical protein
LGGCHRPFEVSNPLGARASNSRADKEYQYGAEDDWAKHDALLR